MRDVASIDTNQTIDRVAFVDLECLFACARACHLSVTSTDADAVAVAVAD